MSTVFDETDHQAARDFIRKTGSRTVLNARDAAFFHNMLMENDLGTT